jgi:hypothetical protein
MIAARDEPGRVPWHGSGQAVRHLLGIGERFLRT